MLVFMLIVNSACVLFLKEIAPNEFSNYFIVGL